jgi:hypothetical protein
MTLLLFLVVTFLAANGEMLEVKTNVPPPPPAVTVKAVADTASTGKSLAEALERLQRPSSQQSKRDHYRVVTLLGGKLSARVPIR